jgi:hypothetical protein
MCTEGAEWSSAMLPRAICLGESDPSGERDRRELVALAGGSCPELP